ncbi:MAG: transcriptional regulator [Clostridia bacterium]|nr:transcriptional regulator [Clostridia bacterium]
MQNKLYYSAMDVSELLGISRSKAYSIVKEMNKELSEKGYIVIAGKVPKKFLEEKCYGIID